MTKMGTQDFHYIYQKNHPLYKNEKRISYPYKIHRAVAELFVYNPYPEEWKIVLHKNDIPDCNLALNLQWGTPKMNMVDKHHSGRARYLRGSEKEVREICDIIYKQKITKIGEILDIIKIRDDVSIKTYENLIRNLKCKHCWKFIINEYDK